MGNTSASQLEVPDNEAQDVQYVPPYLVSSRDIGSNHSWFLVKQPTPLTFYYSEIDTESDPDYLFWKYLGGALTLLLGWDPRTRILP